MLQRNGKLFDNKVLILVVSFILLIGTIIVGLMCGSYTLSVSEVIKTLFGQGTKAQEIAVMQLRLPRIAVAFVVAAALTTSGSILQSVTRNPLAEPGTIGINAGAALAVVLLISAQSSQYYSELKINTVLLMPFVSIIGAILTATCIYLLTYRGKIKANRLILVGIGMNVGLNAIISFYQLNMSRGDYNRVLTWTSGSLWGSSWMYFLVSAPIVFFLICIVIYKSKTLDALQLGEELATGLGIRVQREMVIFLLLATALAAVATSIAGNIAFIGLLGPHIAKRLVGPVQKRYLPASICLSAALLILADTASRNIFSPIEIPVGITISIIGVPYFIYLMIREK